MSARVENNNRGQNAGGQQSGENPGSALDQLRKTSVSYSLEEQVIRAELLWVLKMVESDFSFKSAENMVRLLCLMDEGNQIFRKMSLGRMKCGYYVTHALFPFYLERRWSIESKKSLHTPWGWMEGLSRCEVLRR